MSYALTRTDQVAWPVPPSGGTGAPAGEITRELESLRRGSAGSLDRVVSLLYDELRSLARQRLRGERIGHTLDTTALVHENHGVILLARGRAVEAEAELRPLVPLLAAAHPAGDPRIAEAQVMLARAVIARGALAEGRAILEKHIGVFEEYGLAHPDDIAAARRDMSGSAP